MSTAARPRVLETIAEVREVVAGELAAGRRVSLTPTLGALHSGHLAHLERAAELADTRIVSIFVNPLQFGPNEDLDKYPRTLDSDLERLGELGVPFVFAPTATEMYPAGAPSTHVAAGRIGELYEGRSRPGHFDGVLTVVAKLLLIVTPDIVTFGQKDAQQLFLVRRMIADLNIPVRLEAIEIVREDDGLALSSRNRFLEGKERRAARTLSLALEAAASSADRGIDAVVAAAQGTLMGEPLVELDYLKVVNPDTFLPVDDGYRGSALVLVAARVGSTRLIDNERISLAG
ncbi:MAG TPA: pantoate--beta-alanine ligase [Galbitalea sp.]|nr:pantoate--beta-alanine ligase [Galbitalea sp.]